MRHFLMPILGLLLAAAVADAGAGPAQTVEQLIAQLGAPQAAARAEAQRQLAETVLAPQVYALLKKHADDADAEVRTRVREILDTVGVTILASAPVRSSVTPAATASIPVVSDADIVSYNWDTHTVQLTVAAFKRLQQAEVTARSFTLVVGKETCYSGLLGEAVRFMSSAPSAPVLYTISTGDKTMPENSFTINGPHNGVKDPRPDDRLFRVLAASGRLTWSAGLEARLRTEKIAWKTGQTPVVLLHLANKGPNDMAGVAPVADRALVEVDGRWYGWAGAAADVAAPPALAKGAETPSPIKIALDGSWRLHEVQPTFAAGSKISAPHGPPLELAPGKHTVRVAYRPAGAGDDPVPTAVSNPLLVEVIGPGSSGKVPPDAVEKLITQLGAADAAARREAAKKLSEIVRTPRGYPLIKKHADDADAEVRARVREVLSEVAVALYVIDRVPDAKKTLDQYTLDPEPLVADEDILSCNWDAHTFRLTARGLDRIRKADGGQKWGFVVAVGKERCYRGVFYQATQIMSIPAPGPICCTATTPQAKVPDESIVIVAAPDTTAGDVRGCVPLLEAMNASGRLVWTANLQVALRADKTTVPAGTAPVLSFNVINTGWYTVENVVAAPDFCQLQVDGQWYAWTSPAPSEAPSETLGHTDMIRRACTIVLSDGWRPLTDGFSPTPVFPAEDCGKEGLRLSPGKHTVRIALQIFGLKYRALPTAYSNALQIEVLAPDKPG
jgi:hypothetical protein